MWLVDTLRKLLGRGATVVTMLATLGLAHLHQDDLVRMASPALRALIDPDAG
ncbi:hypothetical protein [Mycobacterium sp. OTB74]|jgi:hypothetical protein|uniref:hypothetical protein n=1 Tax=Mycobacterium sp. OTB74 TaxID=1853452 RepID=UPI0024764BEC|nr:hypothetical protein [Mycobacterium sp. OTB74]MDH6243697.1 hypothetical protein [Mycobacterium sp. OTB74]